MEGALSQWLVLGLGGGASALFLLWRARVSPVKSNLLVGTLWLLLMVLGWHLLQPQAKVLDEAILLTEGADSDALRDVLRRVPKGTRVFALPEAGEITLASQPISHAPDTAWLGRAFAKTGTWHLVGWGLPKAALDRLLPAKIVAYPTQAPLGFEWANWPKTLTLGQALTFRGRLVRPLPAGWFVRLEAPSGATVAEIQPAKSQVNVQLQDRPSLAGAILYSVTVVNPDEEVILREAVPVQVEAPKQRQVWMVLGSPRFETKYLKHWLGSRGNRLAIRTLLTEADWHDDAINRDPLPKDLETWPWREADVFVTDMAALTALDSGARKALREAVEEGLGLFLFPEGMDEAREFNALEAKFFGDWQLNWQADGVEEMQAALNWHGQYPMPKEKTEILPAEIELRPGQRMLMDDGFGAVIAAAVKRGEGTVGTSLVAHSYRWALQGDWADFRAYWSQLFTQIGRRQAPPPRWHIDGPVLVGEPSHWHLWAPNNAPFRTGPSGPERFWESDAMNLGRKSGIAWADAPGWHDATYNDVPLPAFYVFPKTAWKAAQARAKLAATEKFMTQHGQDAEFMGPGFSWPWAMLLGLALVLLAGVLWLGEKLQRL